MLSVGIEQEVNLHRAKPWKLFRVLQTAHLTKDAEKEQIQVIPYSRQMVLSSPVTEALTKSLAEGMLPSHVKRGTRGSSMPSK